MNLCHLNIKAYCYEWRTRIKYNFYDTKIAITHQITWDFVKAPHGLVTGITGGGKTYFYFM